MLISYRWDKIRKNCLMYWNPVQLQKFEKIIWFSFKPKMINGVQNVIWFPGGIVISNFPATTLWSPFRLWSVILKLKDKLLSYFNQILNCGNKFVWRNKMVLKPSLNVALDVSARSGRVTIYLAVPETISLLWWSFQVQVGKVHDCASSFNGSSLLSGSIEHVRVRFCMPMLSQA